MALVPERMLLIMQFCLIMLAVATITTLLSAAQTLAPPQAMLGCPEKCGDLTIPYPFGLGEDCSMRPEFTITCDQSTTAPPSANFTNATFTFPIAITNFNLDDGELQVMQDIARDCYDDEGTNTKLDSLLELPPPYTISAKNDFFTLGCNVLGGYEGVEGGNQTGFVVAICLDDLGNELPESCTGFGCARTSIPRRLQNISISLASLDDYNSSNRWDSKYPCSYAFIVEEGKFTFDPKSSFEQLKTTRQQLPVVVNWAIGDEPCEVANKNPTTYSCKEHASCVNRSTITNGTVGYICRCLPGYKGNPYLGCQDIDECKEASGIDPCKNGKCVNSPPGNYSCTCNKGFRNQDAITCIPYSSSNNISLKISLGVSISFLVLVVLVLWIYRGMNKIRLIKLKEKYFKENGGLTLQQQLASHRGAVETAKIFTAEELKKATNNYHADEILGEGAYGKVYKGILSDNNVVAIKKPKIGAPSQSDQFINEVIVLSQINHRNIVKLLGCCLETEVPLLVYEYITHGTLFEHIFNKAKGSSLSWELRLKIASETAGALAYLHFSTSTPIIHRDVKSTNILLDDNYTAKVSDFGASRFIPLDQTQLATLVQGTLGYLDPEYFHSSQLTEKSDVYSFGVVLAELLTSRVALSYARPDSERCLASFFVSSIEKECLIQILDADIVNEENMETIEQVANLAKRCLRIKSDERPTMKEVAMELEGMRIMAKHPWKNGDSCPEETEYLLGSPNSAAYVVDIGGEGDGGSSATNTGYDSMQIQMLMPSDDGR